MSTIIIGVDESERSEDAIAFGGALARDTGAAVTVAHAYPWQHLGFRGNESAASGPNYVANRHLLSDSEAVLRRLTAPLRDLPGLETRSLPDTSAPRALQALAEELGAGMIVVGSSHTSRLGRVLPGSTAERLLHGAPCPVAVVPRDYHTAGRDRPRVIACGWDGTPESEAALAAAEGLARDTTASLRVIRAFQPTFYAYPPALGVGYARFTDDARTHAEHALTERMSQIPADVAAESELHEGLAARELTEASHAVDLMVVGSRGYGPMQAVLLGGVSGRLVREARCPVIVVPNGSRSQVRSTSGAGGAAVVA